MRRALIPLVVTLTLVCVACGSEESETLDLDVATTELPQTTEAVVTTTEESQSASTAVTVMAEFDGTRCVITEADPAYVAADEDGLDLLTASTGANLTFLVTNTSGLGLTGLVNRYDPSLSPGEATALTKDLAVDDGTLYERPDFIVGPAAQNLSAAALTINENQLQYHYTLQPGLNTTIVYTQDGIWPCRTSEAEISLVNVASEAATSG